MSTELPPASRFVGKVDWLLDDDANRSEKYYNHEDEEAIRPDVFDIPRTGGGGCVSCTGKRPAVESLAMAVKKNNPSVPWSESFVRRPGNTLCYCTGWKYNIVLRRTYVTCAGCGHQVRSGDHCCRVRDLFTEDRWLGKSDNHVYTDIRKKNFESLAKRLPYVLPDDVLDDAAALTTACRSVEFVDTDL